MSENGFFAGNKNEVAPKDNQKGGYDRKNFSEEDEKKQEEIFPGKITKIFDGKVLFPTIDPSGKKIIFYDENSFWEMSFDGFFKKKIVDEKIPNLNAIIWSPDKKSIIIKVDGGFYNYEYSKEPTKIKDGIIYLVWSNLGDKIIYTYRMSDSKNQELNISDKDGGNWRHLTTIDSNKIISAVPETSLIAFWDKPAFKRESVLNTISISGGEGGKVFKEDGIFGADYLWSPNGEKFLISSVIKGSSNKMKLEIRKMINDKNIINLNFPTMVSKCVWSKNNKDIFCALPSEIPDNMTIPDDYRDKKFYTTDSFWRINTISGKKERLVKLEDIPEEIDAENLFLSPNEDILFLTNRRNNNLYRITL